jgi:hypothetical protein
MAPERLSRLQRRILAWLAAEGRRTKRFTRASHQDLVCVLAHDKGNLSTSLEGLEVKSLVTIARTPSGRRRRPISPPRGVRWSPGSRKVVNKGMITEERPRWPRI